MFHKKNRSSSRTPQHQHDCQDSTLPKLQRLAQLQSEIIGILGKKNIVLDEEADIFSRLEDIYIHSLQATVLGFEMLERCLKIIGDCESPSRVRFLYFYAHEMKLKGAAADEVQPVLLESYHSNLTLKNKLDLGFKSGLVFCQISQHVAEVDKILCNLIVALEQELGYKPQKKLKVQSSSSHINAETKAIYLGTRVSHKSAAKNGQNSNKMQRLEMFKFLFEAFVTGERKIQSEAKRHYYVNCKEELKNKLIREYPGRDIERKLNSIEESAFASLREFSQKLKASWRQEEVEVVPNRSLSKSRNISKGKKDIRSQSQSHSQLSLSNGMLSLKNSFNRDGGDVRSSAMTPQTSTWSTPTRNSGFKLHIRKKSQHKLNLKENEPANPTKEDKVIHQQQTEEEFCYAKPEPRPEVTPLIFKQAPENTKEIVLKFDKFHQQSKFQVKKKKLKHTFNWQKNQKENHVQRVVDIIYLPQIKEERSNDFTPSVQIKQKQEVPQEIPEAEPEVEQIQEEHIEQEVAEVVEAVQPSVSDLNSARRIDQILKEGIQWMAHLQNQDKHENKSITSDHSISQCQIVPEKEIKQAQTFFDTLNIKEERQEESSHEKSYKIVIQHQEKPELQLIICQEVSEYLSKNSQRLIKEHLSRQQDKESKRMSKLNELIKKSIFVKECEVSIEMKKEQEASDCSKTFEVEPNNQSSDLVSETKTLEQKQQEVIVQPPIPEVQHNSQSDLEEELQLIIRESSKEVDFSLEEQVIATWLQEVFSAVSQLVSRQNTKKHSDIHNAITHECSIKEQTQEISFPSREKSDHCSSPREINEDGQYSNGQEEFVADSPEDPIKDNLDLESKGTFLAPFAQEDKRDNVSLFTCSRFAGSKIDYEKESDFQWKSQVNFINEILKEDKIAENQLNLPEKDSNSLEKRAKYIRQDIQEVQSSSRIHRPRTQSDISNNTNIRQPLQGSIRTLKREKTHNCLSICYDDFDSITQSSKKFTHWLCPELKVKKDKLAFLIFNKDVEHQKEIPIPSFVPINDDTIKQISAKVEAFLQKYPTKSNLSPEEWQQIKNEVDQFDLQPQHAQIRPFMLIDKDTREEDQVRCIVNIKQNRIVIESIVLGLKTYPIVASSSQQLQEIVSKLDSNIMSIRNQDLLVKDVWSFIGQRNIKLREKTDNNVHHFTFDILQRYNDSYKFDYCVRQQKGESFNLEGVEQSKRARIVKNMDTIIGFVLKVVDERVQFNTKNLNQFLNIL